MMDMDGGLGGPAPDAFTTGSKDGGPGSGECSPPPKIVVNDDDPSETLSDISAALRWGREVFERMGIVRVGCTSSGQLKVGRLDAHGIMTAVYDLTQVVRRKTVPGGEVTYQPCSLPLHMARLYLSATDRGLPELAAISRSPLLSAGGGVLAVHGYDEASRVLVAPMPALDLKLEPSKADARNALMCLRAVIETFPFADAKTVKDTTTGLPLVDPAAPIGLDESCALAALLTAICRSSLDLAPGLLVRAPAISGAGTGKGRLVRLITTVAFGEPVPAMTAGDTRAELDKRLEAALLGGAAGALLDNVNGRTLKSDRLASMLTEPVLQIRPLRASEVHQVTNRMFLAITGNGLAISEDLARRFLCVNLDAGVADAEARPFPEGFDELIRTQRGALLSAALTIWRWGQIEKDLPRGRPLGSFERWARWVRDPLLALGCRDVVEVVEKAKASDAERQWIGDLFNLWHDVHGLEPVKANSLHPTVLKRLMPVGGSRQNVVARLMALDGARVGGFVLTKQEAVGKWGAALYRLQLDESAKP
ncbi:hypothetical protein [Falsiroseomonas oryziterrae]|uniref:hypothetical protein n=1 Tax=Falsiroseomonas oryziterrae TaxID=2911368 RepID=UPI001F2A762D|nr:hypothetical protein [Roseomonas sp. NPKOSM-4]